LGQLKSGIETGKAGGPEPPDEDHLNLHQAFAELALPVWRSNTLTTRLGRQEFSYGSSRLVSVREGPNVRQSFHALKVFYHSPRGQADAFLGRPVQTERGVFDDAPDRNRLFWGTYATGKLPRLSNANLDVYYLGFTEKNAAFKDGTADERRHSFGIRGWNKVGLLQYNVEGVYQLGSFGPKAISAYTLSGEFTYAITPAGWEPFFNLKAEILSGDRRGGDDRLQTFNPLFPKGAYFGQVALIGPANLVDLHPWQASPRYRRWISAWMLTSSGGTARRTACMGCPTYCCGKTEEAGPATLGISFPFKRLGNPIPT
jgi:hypothetical protein